MRIATNNAYRLEALERAIDVGLQVGRLVFNWVVDIDCVLQVGSFEAFELV